MCVRMDVDNNIELLSAGFKLAYGEERGLIRQELTYNETRCR